MVGKASSFGPARRTLRGFTYALRSAACEWLLIFLLLLDAVFAYLLTRFSRYCRLQVPCLFCSRLDHILGNEKPGFYRDLICKSHRAEMSCLIFCHNHGKLADGRAMCDNCLLSYSTMLKENSDMQRVVVGKLGYDLASNGPPNLFTNKDLLPGSVATKLCSCCRKPWRSRQRADRILRLKSPRSAANSKPNIPLPHRLTQQESLRKIREKFSGSLTPCRLGSRGFDSLSHVGYTELKFNSDSESEFQYSDDEEYHNYGHEVEEPPREEEQPATRSASGKAADNEMDQQSWKHGMHSSAEDHGERDVVIKSENGKGSSAVPELILLEDLHPANMAEVPHVLKEAKNEQNKPSVLTTDSAVLSELMALVDSPSAFTVSKDHFDASKVKGLDGIGATDDFNNKQHEGVKLVADAAAAGTQGAQVAYDVPSTDVTSSEHNETPKASITVQERETPKFMVEKLGKREILEDLKPSSSKETDASSKTNVPALHLRDSTMPPEPAVKDKVHDSTLESIDGIVNEIEGENIDDRLKRQIEHDRILISTLTKELDEERSASAIAANQAMAMITRLQEEKAALHMEALQYLRMMEEQAEYDGEELEKTNDLLAEREKELQDLEAELEYFRIKYGDDDIGESMPNTIMSSTSRDDNMVGEDTTSSSYAEHEVSEHHSGSNPRELPNGSEKGDVFTRSSWPDIEDEKSFIFQRLKGLERKLRKLSPSTAASPYMSDSEYSEETTDRGIVVTGEFLVGNGNLPVHEEPDGKDKTIVGSLVRNGQRTPNPLHEADLATLKNEISDLNERLESLETDWSFLEHTFNSLESGKEGLQFVQEIAHRLQELRKIGLRSRYQSVPS